MDVIVSLNKPFVKHARTRCQNKLVRPFKRSRNLFVLLHSYETNSRKVTAFYPLTHFLPFIQKVLVAYRWNKLKIRYVCHLPYSLSNSPNC